MRRLHHPRLLAAVPAAMLLLLGGCVDPGKGGPGEVPSMDDDDDDDGNTSFVEPSDTDEPDEPEDESSTGEEPDTEGDDVSFIEPPEDIEPMCDVWTQDCPGGQKCMPWANDGGNLWNSLKCVDIAENPGQPGDDCTVEGSGVSGLDSCDIGSMCWGVDGETNTGTCVSMCAGDQEAPFCEDPDASCVIVNDGVLTVCLPTCDPLLQDCRDTEACYPVNGTFTCAPNASGPELGAYGDPCEAINTCDAGLFCASAEAVPNCQGSLGCCSDFCDLSAVDPTDECSGADGGQECLPWFEEGEAPPGSESYGACAVPST